MGRIWSHSAKDTVGKDGDNFLCYSRNTFDASLPGKYRRCCNYPFNSYWTYQFLIVLLNWFPRWHTRFDSCTGKFAVTFVHESRKNPDCVAHAPEDRTMDDNQPGIIIQFNQLEWINNELKKKMYRYPSGGSSKANTLRRSQRHSQRSADSAMSDSAVSRSSYSPSDQESKYFLNK